MASTDPTVRIIGDDGVVAPTEAAEPYADRVLALGEDDLLGLLRDMVRTRAFDVEAANLQRQGHLALWAPSYGQEAAQIGSGRAARSQDTIFPAYREHGVAHDPRPRPGRHRADDARRRRTADGIPREHGNFRQYTPRDRLADAARDGLRDGRRSSTGATATGDPEHGRGGPRLLRRRRDRAGRLERGVRLRGELPDAAGLLPAEQPLGDLGPGRAPVPHAALPPRPPGSACPACRSTATTCWPCSPSPARCSTTPAPAADPRSSRPSPTGSARTPPRTTRRSTDRGGARSAGPPATRSCGCAATSRAAGVGRRRLRRRRRGGGGPRGRRAHAARSSCRIRRRSDDVRARLQRAAPADGRAAGSGCATTRRPTGSER